MASIEVIEGVGPGVAAKLAEAGVSSVEDLLTKGRTKTQREALAGATEIGEGSILKFVNHADLMRINGVGPQYAELLEAAGVDTVAELAQRNAENLAAKLDEINAAKNIANATPGESSVQKWVEEAKALPKLLSY